MSFYPHFSLNFFICSSSLQHSLFSVIVFSLILLIFSVIGKSSTSCAKIGLSNSPLALWTSQAFMIDIGIFTFSIFVQISQILFFGGNCGGHISPSELTVTINLITLFTSTFNLTSSHSYVCRDIFG